MENIHQQHAKVFKALCDPKRLAILEQLRSGEKCACKLQEPLDLTQSGLPHENPLRLRNRLQPSGGQVDPLPAELIRQRLCA